MPEKQNVNPNTAIIAGVSLVAMLLLWKFFGNGDNGNGNGNGGPPDIIITDGMLLNGEPDPSKVPKGWNAMTWATKLKEAMLPFNINTTSILKRHTILTTWNLFPQVGWVDVWNKFNAAYSSKRGTLWQWVDSELNVDPALVASIRLNMNNYIPITSQLKGLVYAPGVGRCVETIDNDLMLIAS